MGGLYACVGQDMDVAEYRHQGGADQDGIYHYDVHGFAGLGMINITEYGVFFSSQMKVCSVFLLDCLWAGASVDGGVRLAAYSLTSSCFLSVFIVAPSARCAEDMTIPRDGWNISV